MTPGALEAFRAKLSDDKESFLKASDVVPGEHADILGFGFADFDDGKKPYVRLNRRGIGNCLLVLNRANGRALASVGDEDSLVGVAVTLNVETVDFKGRKVGSIRLALPPQSHP